VAGFGSNRLQHIGKSQALRASLRAMKVNRISSELYLDLFKRHVPGTEHVIGWHAVLRIERHVINAHVACGQRTWVYKVTV
jgi:hypothetical protein